MKENKALEKQMLAALKTNQYCTENNLQEWDVQWLESEDDETWVYTPEAQAFFNIQMINLQEWR